MSQLFRIQQNQRGPSSIKTVNIIANGNPDKTFSLQLRLPITLAEVAKAAESRWGVKFRNMRLFNPEGVEYFEEDLKYLKDNENIYLSKGQEFDANSSFGEYEVLKSLGEGGFGKVSLGRHKTNGELVAIKVMKANKIKNAHEIDLVFREVENLKALNHPNIVKIYNCYTLREMQVIVIMEYLEGGELLQYLRTKGRLELKETLLFFKKIASAIEYCHSKNIVHRDLKLENILIKKVESQDIKVADFGISGVAEQFNPDVDSGTLKYMAPEVLSGNQKGNSPAVDVWALGCIFYYLLFGKLPFVGRTSSETIRLIIDGCFKVPKQIPVKESALTLLSRMLDVNPKTRIKITDLCDELPNLEDKHIFCNTEESLASSPSSNNVNSVYSRYSRDSVQSKFPDLYISKNINNSINSPESINAPVRSSSPNKLGGQNKRTPLYAKKTTIQSYGSSSSTKPPVQTTMVVPKRLEKQKDIIENQLKQYQNRKKPAIVAPSANGSGSGQRALFKSYEKGSVKSQQIVKFQKDKIGVGSNNNVNILGNTNGLGFGFGSKIKPRDSIVEIKKTK